MSGPKARAQCGSTARWESVRGAGRPQELRPVPTAIVQVESPTYAGSIRRRSAEFRAARG